MRYVNAVFGQQILQEPNVPIPSFVPFVSLNINFNSSSNSKKSRCTIRNQFKKLRVGYALQLAISNAKTQHSHKQCCIVSNIAVYSRKKTDFKMKSVFFQLYSPYGESYCFAVIFGLRPSDIRFASLKANIISLKPTVSISLSQRENITPTKSEYR